MAGRIIVVSCLCLAVSVASYTPCNDMPPNGRCRGVVPGKCSETEELFCCRTCCPNGRRPCTGSESTCCADARHGLEVFEGVLEGFLGGADRAVLSCVGDADGAMPALADATALLLAGSDEAAAAGSIKAALAKLSSGLAPLETAVVRCADDKLAGVQTMKEAFRRLRRPVRTVNVSRTELLVDGADIRANSQSAGTNLEHRSWAAFGEDLGNILADLVAPAVSSNLAQVRSGPVNVAKLTAKLQAILDRTSVTDLGDMGMTLGVALPTGEGIALKAGLASSLSMPPKPMRLDDKLGWGSTTKMFTAVAVLDLMHRRNISLDSEALPLMDEFFVKITNGTSLVTVFGPAIRNVTLRQLLSMRSGVHDYDEKSRGYQMLHMLLDLGPDLMLSRIFIDEGKGFDFPPGTQGEYSSSNFVLLGLVLAQAAAASGWDTYDQAAAFPADLMGKMTFAVHGPCNRSEYQPMAHGLTLGNPLVNFTLPKDAYRMSCLNGWTCGNLLATGIDVARWVQALFTTERLVSRKTLEHMLTMQPLTVGWESKEKLLYGLGLMDVSLNAGEPHGSGKLVGHGGETIGFNSMTGYMKDVNATLAVCGNMDPYIVPIRLVTLQAYHAIVRAFNCPARRWWQRCL